MYIYIYVYIYMHIYVYIRICLKSPLQARGSGLLHSVLGPSSPRSFGVRDPLGRRWLSGITKHSRRLQKLSGSYRSNVPRNRGGDQGAKAVLRPNSPGCILTDRISTFCPCIAATQSPAPATAPGLLVTESTDVGWSHGQGFCVRVPSRAFLDWGSNMQNLYLEV